ncbi:MAG: hypothetical protein ACOVQ8_03330 [Elstera sp.]
MGALAISQGFASARSLQETHEIQAGFLSACLWPQAGGRIASLRFAPPGRTPLDILVPLTRTPFDPDVWPKGGCYPLVPWSNRIRNAQFSVEGRTIALRPHPACLPHAHHGFTHQRRWDLSNAAPTTAQMSYTHSPDADAWPWAFIAVQTLRIAPDGLSIDLSVTNVGTDPMPVGMGLHPFLVVSPGDEIDFITKSEWRADADGLAISLSPVAGGAVHCVQGSQGSTRYFAGWQGIAVLRRIEGARVTVTASAPLDHLVFHVPEGGAYACLEPVSHVADAFNLAAKGVAKTGFLTLAAGQTLSTSVHIGVS